jgi:hypothetical protein
LGVMYGYVLCTIVRSLKQTKKDYIYSMLIFIFAPLFLVYMIFTICIDEIKVNKHYRAKRKGHS